MIRNHDDTHQSTRIGCLHERRSYSRVHTTPGSNVDTPIAEDTSRSRMIQKFYLWAPKGISSSVVTHAPSPPGRMRLTSRQSISPWCATRRVFRHRREQQAARRNSRRHRRSTSRAAVPHPSTKLPPRKTARSDALTIEMSGLKARPPTAPESWLRVGSAPPLGIKASTTSHPTSQAGSERDSTPDTARAQTPYPSDRTGPPRSSPHTVTHRQIECLSQADSTEKERRERGERERERREERVRECAHVRSGEGVCGGL